MAAQEPDAEEQVELLERQPGHREPTASQTYPESSSQNYSVSRHTVWALYGSHFLSAWGERMWEFAVGLVMLKLQPDSLFLVSALGVLEGLAVVVAGGSLGAWIDRTERLKAASRMYLLQNAAIAASAVSSLAALLLIPSSAEFLSAALIVCTIASTALSSVASLGSTLSVEREWTKQLCQDDSARLVVLNASMRRIDLSCLILSPIAVGVIMTYAGVAAAVGAITAWNLLAWLPECWLLKHAHSECNRLRESKAVRQDTVVAASKWQQFFSNAGWGTYLRQPVVAAAISLALLYLTVLSMGLLMTAYLNWKGMSEAELSLYRGLGALSGISATFLFPWLQACVGLDVAGGLGIWFQLCCLIAAVSPVLIGRLWHIADAVAGRILVSGLVTSRLGLWLFDLSVNQMLQERVNKEEIGVVNGVQGSLCSVFTTLSYVAGLVVWEPEKFEVLMLASCAVVLGAAVLYTSASSLPM